MAIEYLTGLNAIVMKAIWNIKKEYRERISKEQCFNLFKKTGEERFYRDKERRKKKFYLFES